MNREDIIRMAREAGLDVEKDILCRYEGWVEPIERFATLVVAAEREDCAKVLDEMADYMESEMEPSEVVAWVRSKAASIRARGQA